MEDKNRHVQVFAFVGPSGTGKSYRAQLVANENNAEYIIDDGLLISGNRVVAGQSAKKAPTKIETIKKAIFNEEKERKEMIRAIKKYKVKSILILGTSDAMVEKIALNLELPKISKIVYIQDVATGVEMETAKRIRRTEGKHVIPVPSFEIKKDFAGYILDPLQIFKSKGRGEQPYITEKSIIRPTFSYLGNFTISDTVFRQIMEYLATKTDTIYRVIKTRVENTPEGPDIYMEVSVYYGFNVIQVVNEFKIKAIKEINKLTTMNVKKMSVIVKEIKFEDNN
ncbi:MAG: ATP-binding protein [Clostridia bacterium]|nr:ATP-binding protein [Clostridia bacterium]